MATITIRNLSEDLVERIKSAASQKGLSMEQEVREVLQYRYMRKQKALSRIRARWNSNQAPTAEEVQQWIETGRS